MIRTNVPHIFFLVLLFLISNISYTYADWQPAKEGNKIILIRHSIAPGSGDPSGFQIKDCKTQRNLSKEGIKQSKKIGKLFKINQIKIDQVLSSQWCRCKDTAKYAFKNFETLKALNSFYDEKFYKFKDKQIKSLRKLIKNWDGVNNLIFVTHYVVISEMLNIGVSSGEIVITNKNYQITT